MTQSSLGGPAVDKLDAIVLLGHNKGGLKAAAQQYSSRIEELTCFSEAQNLQQQPTNAPKRRGRQRMEQQQGAEGIYIIAAPLLPMLGTAHTSSCLLHLGSSVLLVHAISRLKRPPSL